MKNCLHNSEIHKTWKQLYLISQGQLKIHPVLPTCSALLYTSAGTLTERQSPLKCILQHEQRVEWHVQSTMLSFAKNLGNPDSGEIVSLVPLLNLCTEL